LRAWWNLEIVMGPGVANGRIQAALVFVQRYLDDSLKNATTDLKPQDYTKLTISSR